RGRRQIQVMHRHQNPALHRLQPIPHIRQGPRHQSRDGISEVGAPKLLLDIDDEHAGPIAVAVVPAIAADGCNICVDWHGNPLREGVRCSVVGLRSGQTPNTEYRTPPPLLTRRMIAESETAGEFIGPIAGPRIEAESGHSRYPY